MVSMKAIDVKTLSDYILEVTFENGEIRKFDVKPYLKYKAFARVREIKVFNTVKTDGMSIEWEDGTDICPLELYNNSYL